jgi:hypothetical protein
VLVGPRKYFVGFYFPDGPSPEILGQDADVAVHFQYSQIDVFYSFHSVFAHGRLQLRLADFGLLQMGR